jgi:hypothetical protein
MTRPSPCVTPGHPAAFEDGSSREGFPSIAQGDTKRFFKDVRPPL